MLLFIQLIAGVLLFYWFIPTIISYYLCRVKDLREPSIIRCSGNAIMCVIIQIFFGSILNKYAVVWTQSLFLLLIAVFTATVISKQIMKISFFRALLLSIFISFSVFLFGIIALPMIVMNI